MDNTNAKIMIMTENDFKTGCLMYYIMKEKECVETNETKGKKEEGIFLLQQEGRISIPRRQRESLYAQPGDLISGVFWKATDDEILKALKRKNEVKK